MFSSKSKEPVPAASASSSTAAPQQKRTMRSSSAPSIISADLVVTGTLASSGDIQIDGTVEGDVRSVGLVIGDKAVINGEIYAEDVTVRGRVNGGIRAHKVLLCSTSHVEGNILHEAFAVETGAFFEGNCRHADNPLASDAAVRKAPEPAAVRPATPINSSPAVATSGPSPMAATASPLNAVARTMPDMATRPVGTAFTPLKPGN